ncbi:MAG: DUF2007 domain-containing protein [Candidatus Amulumruptor caecigallinarius]|nr:DUF2007 domain-containing protein [Candidatus Amulumruptor caecigallinarius]MCM1396748.1 DUF2007 domain-containing protein [Candidatus Amulumruptor caecigallinarius]MCM1453194.1 DUF2007 domain-containing protein [bacterium]
MSQLVLAATFPDLPAAAIARGMLAANGIESILDNATFSSIYPIGFNTLGEVRLMVDVSDLAEARHLLTDHCDIISD